MSRRPVRESAFGRRGRDRTEVRPVSAIPRIVFAAVRGSASSSLTQIITSGRERTSRPSRSSLAPRGSADDASPGWVRPVTEVANHGRCFRAIRKHLITSIRENESLVKLASSAAPPQPSTLAVERRFRRRLDSSAGSLDSRRRKISRASVGTTFIIVSGFFADAI